MAKITTHRGKEGGGGGVEGKEENRVDRGGGTESAQSRAGTRAVMLRKAGGRQVGAGVVRTGVLASGSETVRRCTGVP